MTDEHRGTFDSSDFPPEPVVWATATVDTCCSIAGCSNWRAVLPSSFTDDGAWFSEEHRIPPLSSVLPPLLSYRQYLQQHDASSSSWRTVVDYSFRTSSTDLADLSTPTAAVVLLVVTLLMRLLKKTTIPRFSGLGRKAACATHGPEWVADNETRIVKFGEYVFRLIFHSAISVVGIVYFWDKAWWKQGGTLHIFVNYPHHKIEPGMIWYYMIQSAYNLEAMLSLLELSFCLHFRPLKSDKGELQSPVRLSWSPTVRGDFQEMFIHHLVTNLLVIGSSAFRFTRIGSMVFLVHDLSDVPVDMSKLANFLKWKATTVACFTLMVLVWLATRLGVLPFVIYRSVLSDSWLITQQGPTTAKLYHYYRHFFYVLIGMLIGLHLAWFAMFIRMGYVLVSKGETHDLSEHKAGEQQDTTGTSAATTASAGTKKEQ